MDESGNNDRTLPYCHNVNLYLCPPAGNISLEYAKELIEERLNILHALHLDKIDFRSICDYTNYYVIIKKRLSEASAANGINFFHSLTDIWDPDSPIQIDARRRDLVGHFILRLYYCQTEKLRTWFINRELELFRLRFMDENNRHHIPSFLEANNIQFGKISEYDIKRHPGLKWLINFDNKNCSYVYIVPFEKCPYLLKTRKVYISEGWAYVPSNLLLPIFCQMFKENLDTCLRRLRRRLPHLLQEELIHYIGELDDRLRVKFHTMSRPLKKALPIENSSIDIEDIHSVSVFFPPCMLNIYKVLHRDSHIKHFARIHYCQFLKNIGLNMENALEYFRSEFLKKMDLGQFEKNYAPNFRYNYGKSGKANYSAFGCRNIIERNAPGPNDVYGCPFVTMDCEKLSELLDLDLKLAIRLKQKSPQFACSEYLTETHLKSTNEQILIYHPNQYFKYARNLTKSDSSRDSR